MIVARTHQIIQKRNFGICVNITEFQFVFTEIKIPWGMQWEKSSVHLWRYWTKDLQTEFRQNWEQRGYCIKEVVVMTKVRVHELAKELGMENKELVDLLQKKNVDVKKSYEYTGRRCGQPDPERESRTGGEKGRKAGRRECCSGS